MADAGGSASAWQVLLLVRSSSGARSRAWPRRWASPAPRSPITSTRLEAQGLVRRWREDSNRRVQRVELTDEGIALFERLRAVAIAARQAPALAPHRRGGRAARRAAGEAARGRRGRGRDARGVSASAHAGAHPRELVLERGQERHLGMVAAHDVHGALVVLELRGSGDAAVRVELAGAGELVGGEDGAAECPSRRRRACAARACARPGVDARVLGELGDEARDVGPEALGELVRLAGAVLDDVVQQRGDDDVLGIAGAASSSATAAG